SGGHGPCRAGHYGQLHEEILTDLGYEFEMIVFEALSDGLKDFFSKVQRVIGSQLSWWELIKLARREWQRLRILDQLEQLSHQVRPRELEQGATTQAFDKIENLVAEAETINEVEVAYRQGKEILTNIPQDEEYQPLRIGLIGEIYVVLEPFANLEIERILGEMGVEVDRSIYLTEWTKDHTFFLPNHESVQQAAKPYLDQLVGGHGQDSVGNTVLYAKEGFDGVIQLAPFTCIPEIVAKSILPQVSKDYNIPFLTLFLDEKTGEAGTATRLEAFVDLLTRKRERSGGRRS
ncbi:MAG: CoA protein activase, partial [Bacillota bacterium]